MAKLIQNYAKPIITLSKYKVNLRRIDFYRYINNCFQVSKEETV